MSKQRLAELEAECMRHEDALREHAVALERLTPLLAEARWEAELRQPASYISINGEETLLRFVEQKQHNEGVIFVLRPIERDNKVRFLAGQAGNTIHVDATALGIGAYYYPSSFPWSRGENATFTHGGGDCRWGGWRIDFELAGNFGGHPSGRTAFRVKEVRFNQERDDEDE